jgi:hypothetical protein
MNIFDDKKSIGVMVKAIQASKESVPLNKTWRYLNEELGIGDVLNKSLHLTATDRNNLSKIILAETGVNPETFDISFFKTATRTQASSTAINEKWAGRKVKEDIVYIRTLTNIIQLEEDFRIPDNSYLALTWQQASKHHHKMFVVIENLEAFLMAEQAHWPEEIKQSNPLFIYRGDTEATPAALNKFIENSHQAYSTFFDYDPAGLMMALTLPRTPAIVIPDLSNNQLKRHSKHRAFNKQITARMYLEKANHYHSQANSMLENKVAVMQERMISQRMPLMLVD